MKHYFGKKLLAGVLSTVMVAGAFGTSAIPSLEVKAAEDNTFTVLSLNVAGLPAVLSSSDPSNNTKQMSSKLNNYNLVSVQEDFAYDSDLRSEDNHAYVTEHSGNVPLGDGMNFFSDYPLYETTRTKWNESSGFITNGADQMTPKGILYSSMEIADGMYVDIYDIHTDADTDDGSMAARYSNLCQLADMINTRSVGKAVIVVGDTNSRYTRDKIAEAVLDPCGLTDAWVDLVRGGDAPDYGADAVMDSANPNSANNEVVDKIWYRSGRNIDLEAIDYNLLVDEFTDSDGEQLSDHYPITATFSYTLDEDIKTTETYGGGGGTGFSFLDEMSGFPEKVAIAAGNRLDSISFTYDGTTVSAGGNGGTYQEMSLSDDEYITSMEVCKVKKSLTGTYRISYVKLTTNLGNVLEGGSKQSKVYSFEAPSGYGIAGVHGCSADEVDRLGAIYMKR